MLPTDGCIALDRIDFSDILRRKMRHGEDSKNFLRLNPSRPIPRANTGAWIKNVIADTSTCLLRMERRIDPFFRPAIDALFQDLLARVVTALINLRRKKHDLRLPKRP